MAKFCTNCGVNLKEDQKFCVNCGQPVDGGVNPNQSANNQTNNNNNYNNIPRTGKNRVLAGILAIIFGSFGVHNFYLGYNGKAVAQLLITVLSCCSLSFISYIWGFVEGIMILAGSINEDANGNPLVD